MPQFSYKAGKPSGQVFQGVVEAGSEEDAINLLEDKGYKLVYLEKMESSVNAEAKKSLWSFAKNSVSGKEVVIFARQLSVMISANVSVVQSLRILIEQTEKPGFKTIITDIADSVESGSKLSSALERYDKVFSQFFVSMIKSGETSGKLDEVLEYLADQTEKDYDLISKIKGAMIYPVFIVGALVLVGIAMLIFVIPQMTSMLTASGATLPITTRILISTSNVFRNYWWALLIVAAGLFFGSRYVIKMPAGRKTFDLMKLKVPIFGKLFQMIYLVRFTQSLSTLTKGGVSLTAALKIVSEVVGNYSYRAIIDQTVKEVEDGNSIAVVFLQSKIVPKLVSQMLSVGEKTGRLDEVLDKVSGFYSREIENMVANMTHLIEPLIMVIIGVAVGGMVASVILPMYNLASTF